MAKFLITKNVNDDNGIKKFTFRIRDMYEKYTAEVTVKASSVQEAKQKVKAQLIGWANFTILRVWDETGATYYGRDLVNFNDKETVVQDESTPEELIEKSENAEKVVDADSYYRVTYQAGDNVYSAVMVAGATEDEAKKKFIERKPKYSDRIAGITEVTLSEVQNMRNRGMSVFDEFPEEDDEDFSVSDTEEKIGDWSGVRNGIFYNYHNGEYTITHRNGNVERFPEDKFNTAEELYQYIDTIKDTDMTCEGAVTLDDAIEVTQEPGTDSIVYVMQSDIDNNLYFYIGQKYSMKDGSWTYAKFKMNGLSPEQLKNDLEKAGWHQVNSGPARVIDSKEGWKNYLDVYDSVPDVKKTAEYLWTWIDTNRPEVAHRLFEEELDKYNTKEEAKANIENIKNNAKRGLDAYYAELKQQVTRMLEVGYKNNVSRLDVLYTKHK